MLWRFLSSAELPFFLYVFGLMLHMPILQQYAYLRFSIQDNFPYHFSAHQTSCGDTLNKTLKALQEKVCLYFDLFPYIKMESSEQFCFPFIVSNFFHMIAYNVQTIISLSRGEANENFWWGAQPQSTFSTQSPRVTWGHMTVKIERYDWLRSYICKWKREYWDQSVAVCCECEETTI